MKYLPLMLAAAFAFAPAHASPGAHGPNGEHLDGPAASGGAAVPRVETFSETFELVGQLSAGELSVLIDRYQTNEPVLNGQLEVEYKGLKAKATFHPDLGDYAVDDAALLEALSAPGKHALLFTLVAGGESDLLEGILEIGQPEAHAHDAAPAWQWLLGAALACLIAVAAVLGRRRIKRKEQTT
jgi:hypothetical protein